MGGASGLRPRGWLHRLRFLPAALAFWAGLAGAQSVTVSPLRANLSATETVAVVTLRNDDPKFPTLVQARPSAWTVVDGEERFGPPRELVVSPAVFRLEPGQEQVIRVSLRGRADERSERLYRVFLQQLPDEAEQGNRSGNVRFLFTVGIPVMVAPAANPNPAPRVAWRVERLPAGEYRLRAANEGTAHLKVSSVSVSTDAGPLAVPGTAAYLLPGTERFWRFKPAAPLPAGPVGLTVVGDDGTSSVVQAALAD